MTRGWLALAIGAAALLGARDAEVCEKHQPTGPCKAERFDFKNVEEACEDRGRRGASSVMHTMMLRANYKKKANLACESCHASPEGEDYTLTKGARSRAAKWFK
jgi:hypothetical protein